MSNPKVLIFDIETAPLLAYCWGLFDQNIGLEQINKDWHILSWSAKWLNDSPKKIMYQDQRGAKNVEDDSKILKTIWKLLDEADVVITQNGKSFDSKKLNARFVANGMKPPSSYQHIDVLRIARKHFAFTSNKLAYMTNKFNKKYKKLDHKKFPGFEMWKECLKDNLSAWKEMEKYNKYDVLALEELYYKLIPWDNSINFNIYGDSEEVVCSCCGSKSFEHKGYYYTNSGKYERFTCKKCGAETRGRENLLTKEKKKSLHKKTNRS